MFVRVLSIDRPAHLLACCASLTDRPVRLRGYSPSLGRLPRHVMPSPVRTAYAAPRHPERDIAPCCAPGRYHLRLRTAIEPSPRGCRAGPGLAADSGTTVDSAAHVEACGDILTLLPQGIAIAGVSVVQPFSTHLLHQAAMTAEAEVSHRDQQKRLQPFLFKAGAEWL
jgi:hypothetical protein